MRIQTRHPVFLSHRHNDSKYVDHLVQILAKHGLKTWVDRKQPNNINGWHDSIIQAIQDCDTVVVVISDWTLADPTWVKSECVYARKLNKHVVPILISQVPLPSWLPIGSSPPIDLVEDFRSGVGSLVERLRSLPEPSRAKFPYVPVQVVIAASTSSMAQRPISVVREATARLQSNDIDRHSLDADEHAPSVTVALLGSQMEAALGAFEEQLAPTMVISELLLEYKPTTVDWILSSLALQRGIFAGGVPFVVTGIGGPTFEQLKALQQMRPNMLVVDKLRSPPLRRIEDFTYEVLSSLMLSQREAIPGFRLFYRP